MNDFEKENIKNSDYLSPLSPSQTYTILKQASFISNSNSEPNNNSPFHTFRCIKKRILWSEDEDKNLKQLINKYGTSDWSLISIKMGKSRSGKQCRERWYNHLNPCMNKDNWTEEEENILFSKHIQLGNKWAEIASFLPGRTLNDIKNHFYSKLRKFIRKILKQINDERLFQINGIDSCKYTCEKIYKMIKKYDITYKNLTKDTILELIIATEKNPKGNFIFFDGNNNENGINEINYNETSGNIKNNNNNIFEESYENYNNNYDGQKNNQKSIISQNNDNSLININNNIFNNYNFKLKLRKYSNLSDNNNDINELNNNNIKIIKNNKNNTREKNNKQKIKSENKLLGQKRKKTKRKYSKKNSNNNSIEDKDKNIPVLILPTNNNKKSKRKSNKNITNKNNSNEVKRQLEKNENEKNNEQIQFCLNSPKTNKNIIFPSSITKSNKSIKQEDFSFSNKYNLLNDYIEPSLQKFQTLPINYDNLLFLHPKNKNYPISDLSYDMLNMNSKNDNTYKNFSCNGNFYKNNTINNTINNNINNFSINNNITIKSINNQIDNKKDNEKSVIINIDLINHQDFTNAFINGNTIEGNERSQYNNSIYNNKNNNNLNIFNQSSPPSIKSFWK